MITASGWCQTFIIVPDSVHHEFSQQLDSQEQFSYSCSCGALTDCSAAAAQRGKETLGLCGLKTIYWNHGTYIKDGIV